MLSELAATGLSLLVFSSDVGEILTLCDRILVMQQGQIRGEFKRGSINQTELTAYVIGSAAKAKV
jgi:ABC-type sugar transport system ATPase subunit